jgi:chitinase
MIRIKTPFAALLALAVVACSGGDGDGRFGAERNGPPVADVGPDRGAAVGRPVLLDASGSSDPDGDPLEFEWQLLTPAYSTAHLAAWRGVENVFVPDVEGVYVVTLVASDGMVQSQPSLVVITVGPPGPGGGTEVTAFAGNDFTASVRTTVTLDGRASYEPLGRPLAYAWVLVEKPAGSVAALSNATRAVPSFEADVEGRYVARLTVTAPDDVTAADEVAITVVNPTPVADPGGDRDAYVGDAVTLAANAVDEDGEPITYAWTLVSRPEASAAALSATGTATTTLVPDVAGWYLVSLVVSDPSGVGETATLTVRAYPPLERLDHRVLDAEYAPAIDRIVTIDVLPNALYVYDPVSGEEDQILLSVAPVRVSVSPDGAFAAVTHDAFLSYVDLEALAVVRTIPVAATLGDVILPGNGYAYAYAGSSLVPVNVTTGAATVPGYYSSYDAPRAALHPNGTTMYATDWSSYTLRHWDLAPGALPTYWDGPYNSSYAHCGGLWLAEDGARIFTKCGNVFRATEARATDLGYAGKLEAMTSVTSVAHSTEAGEVLAIPAVVSWNGTGVEDTMVRTFEDEYLTQTGSVPLPPFLTPVGAFAGHGRHVFFSADGTRRYAIVQADPASAMLDDFAITTF